MVVPATGGALEAAPLAPHPLAAGATLGGIVQRDLRGVQIQHSKVVWRYYRCFRPSAQQCFGITNDQDYRAIKVKTQVQ